MITVKVKNLTKKYGDFKALDKVSFEAKKGEILGIVGKSGAGKSTLIRILRGSLDYDEGEVEILGRKDNFKEITAIHLQRNFALWAEPVINNIIRKLYAIRNNSDELLPMEEEWEDYEKTAIEILKLVGLEHKKDAFANILSGGEKQRLILGRQIAKIYEKGEGVLLLDEPTNHLDVYMVKFLEEIRAYKDAYPKKFDYIKNLPKKTRVQRSINSLNKTSFVFIKNEKNLGRGASRNKAIDIAKGEYIAILDADDIALPKRLEKQFKYMDNNKDIDLLFGWVYFIDEDGNILKEFKPEKYKFKEIEKYFFKEHLTVHPSMMVKSKILKRL